MVEFNKEPDQNKQQDASNGHAWTDKVGSDPTAYERGYKQCEVFAGIPYRAYLSGGFILLPVLNNQPTQGGLTDNESNINTDQ